MGCSSPPTLCAMRFTLMTSAALSCSASGSSPRVLSGAFRTGHVSTRTDNSGTAASPAALASPVWAEGLARPTGRPALHMADELRLRQSRLCDTLCRVRALHNDTGAHCGAPRGRRALRAQCRRQWTAGASFCRKRALNRERAFDNGDAEGVKAVGARKSDVRSGGHLPINRHHERDKCARLRT